MALLGNSRARFDYEFLERIEAGIELLGTEVKSLRNGRGSLDGGRVLVRGGEAFLVGVTIQPWQPSNTPDSYDPERPRKLLLQQKEIAEIQAAEEQKGLTIVPISVYNKGRTIKVEIAIARGKKKTDKRQTIRAREEKRKIERTLKGQ